MIEVIGKLLEASVDTPETKTDEETVPARREKSDGASIGSRVQIVDIGPKDAFFGRKSDFIGLWGVLLEYMNEEEWSLAKIKLDKKLYPSDDGVYPFVQIQFRPINASEA